MNLKKDLIAQGVPRNKWSWIRKGMTESQAWDACQDAVWLLWYADRKQVRPQTLMCAVIPCMGIMLVEAMAENLTEKQLLCYEPCRAILQELKNWSYGDMGVTIEAIQEAIRQVDLPLNSQSSTTMFRSVVTLAEQAVSIEANQPHDIPGTLAIAINATACLYLGSDWRNADRLRSQKNMISYRMSKIVRSYIRKQDVVDNYQEPCYVR